MEAHKRRAHRHASPVVSERRRRLDSSDYDVHGDGRWNWATRVPEWNNIHNTGLHLYCEPFHAAADADQGGDVTSGPAAAFREPLPASRGIDHHFYRQSSRSWLQSAKLQVAGPGALDISWPPADALVQTTQHEPDNNQQGSRRPVAIPPVPPELSAGFRSGLTATNELIHGIRNKRYGRGSATSPSLELSRGGPKSASTVGWCCSKPEVSEAAVNFFDSSRLFYECGGSNSPSLGLPGDPWLASLWHSKCPSKPAEAANNDNKYRGESACVATVLDAEPGEPIRLLAGRIGCSQHFPGMAGEAVLDSNTKRPEYGISSQPIFGPSVWQKSVAPGASLGVKKRRYKCSGSSPARVSGLPVEPKSVTQHWYCKCPTNLKKAANIKNEGCEYFSENSRGASGLPAMNEPGASSINSDHVPTDSGRRGSLASPRPCSGQWPFKTAGAVDNTITRKLCECGFSLPRFGLPCEPKSAARWCSNCPSKPAEAVICLSKRCKCGYHRPVFGLPGEPKSAARWCAKCPSKPEGAVDMVSKHCECGLSRRPVMGLPGEPKSAARWCSRCPSKPLEAMNILSKRCECSSGHPVFGLPGEPRYAARWCSKCPSKPAEAVDITSKRCECGSCQPVFGLPGQPKSTPRWCSKCPTKPAEAVNIMSKRCECGSNQPKFGLPGEPQSAARWCSKCPSKPAEAVNIKSKRCECGSHQPVFGLPGEPKSAARWCSKCPTKSAEAVNIASKRCECGASQPSFGLPWEPRSAARWCSKCPLKSAEAVDRRSRRCECGLSRSPVFGLPGERKSAARWCSKCPAKPAEAVNVKSKRYNMQQQSSSQPTCESKEPEPSAPHGPALDIDAAEPCERRSGSFPSLPLPREQLLKSAARGRGKQPSKLPPRAVDVAGKRCPCGCGFTFVPPAFC